MNDFKNGIDNVLNSRYNKQIQPPSPMNNNTYTNPNIVPANGRINIMGTLPTNNFNMSDKIPVHSSASSYIDAMQGNWQDTSLSKAFFSSQNIIILQNAIRAGVYKLSKNTYVIGSQDEDALKIVMRSVFLQYSANMAHDITNQIQALNKVVLDYCIKQVYGEAQSYLKYKHDVSTLVVPIVHPTSSSYKNKTVEWKGWF
jgi:hypothetical protein